MLFKKQFEKWKQEEKQRLDLSRIEAEDRLGKATNKMHSLYCPIMKANCTDLCIHFKHGYVALMPMIGDLEPEFITSYPRCKLWK